MAELLTPIAGAHAAVAADRLIAHFGGLGRALAASGEQLAAALGDEHHLVPALVAARRLVEAGLREDIRRTAVSPRDPQYRDYLRLVIGSSPNESVHVTFVTGQWGYLADERIATGSPGAVHVSLRLLLSRAFDVGAHGILLAHNHPSGSAEPSSADIRFTRRIARLGRAVDILLLDHLIVGAGAIVSMRERGLL